MIQEGFEVRIARTLALAKEILQKGGIELVVSEIDLAPPSASKAASSGGESDGLALLVDARKSPWGAICRGSFCREGRVGTKRSEPSSLA